METRKNSTKPDWLTDGGLFLSLYYKRRRNKREEIILNSLWCGVVFLSFFNVLCLCRLIMAPHRLRECSLSLTSFSLLTFLSLLSVQFKGQVFPPFFSYVWRLCYFDTHNEQFNITYVQEKKTSSYLIFLFLEDFIFFISFFSNGFFSFFLDAFDQIRITRRKRRRRAHHLSPDTAQVHFYFLLSFFLSFFLLRIFPDFKSWRRSQKVKPRGSLWLSKEEDNSWVIISTALVVALFLIPRHHHPPRSKRRHTVWNIFLIFREKRVKNPPGSVFHLVCCCFCAKKKNI